MAKLNSTDNDRLRSVGSGKMVRRSIRDELVTIILDEQIARAKAFGQLHRKRRDK